MSNQKTFSTINIVLFIVGLVVGAGGVYFTTSTPLQSKISNLEEQVASLNSTISTLRARERIDYLSRQDWDLGMNLTMLEHMLPGDPVFLSVTSQQLGTRTLWSNPREIKLTYLQIKRYYELNFMGIAMAGGDLLGYLVAMHYNGDGFIVNFSSQEHVSYLFESIDTPEEALELIQLAYHRSGYSAYTREYMEITSNEMYLSAVAELRARAKDDEFNMIRLSPVNFTQVSIIEDGFCVERVFFKRSGRERLCYMKALVYNDGSIVEVENYVFIEGRHGLYF